MKIVLFPLACLVILGSVARSQPVAWSGAMTPITLTFSAQSAMISR